MTAERLALSFSQPMDSVMIAVAWIFLITAFLRCHKLKLVASQSEVANGVSGRYDSGRFLFAAGRCPAIAIWNGSDDFSIASIPLDSFCARWHPRNKLVNIVWKMVRTYLKAE